jgi:hypothetical protein
MSEYVTIELSEQVARRAERVARISHRRVEDVNPRVQSWGEPFA